MLTAYHSVTQTLCAKDHAACIAPGHWLYQQLIVAPYSCAVHRLYHLPSDPVLTYLIAYVPGDTVELLS